MRLEPTVRTVTWHPYAALAIGLLAASSSSILIRYAQTEGAPSLLIAAWRVAVAVLILTPFVWARHSAELRALKLGEIGLAMLSGIFLAVHFGTWITSLEYTSVLISATLVTTNPLIVALLTPLLLREKLSRQTMGAILLAIIGGVIISTAGGAGTAPRQEAPLLGALLSFLGSNLLHHRAQTARYAQGVALYLVGVWQRRADADDRAVADRAKQHAFRSATWRLLLDDDGSDLPTVDRAFAF